ncbi:MAG: hypothetical protein GY868_12870 [Deltaproteobacteria bacterium]|nr:hypothetical protein [Deltaproteobacteria bacterium]
MMKFLKIIGLLIILLVVGVGIFIATFQAPQYEDYGVFVRLRGQIVSLMDEYQARERPIMQEFKDFSLPLGFPFNKIFGGNALGVPLKSYHNDKLAVATISQFEVPPRSGYFRDFTLNVRPRSGIRAPALHIDFMKPAPGTSGMCILDFFNVDKKQIPFDDFFGSEVGQVKKAFAMVAPYQKTEADGRGKITKYLDPYKSPYRFELKEPNADDEAARRKYYETVSQAMAIIFPVYFKRLHSLEVEAAFVDAHEEKTKEFVRQIYAEDVAVMLGKKVFKDRFRKYWLDGFWNVDIVLVD